MRQVWEALQQEDSILVCDFDGTLTTSGSSMHGIVHLLGTEDPFSKDRDSLYQCYGKLPGTDEDGARMKELTVHWWQEQLELYVKYKISEEMVMRVGRMLPEREEAVDLLADCQEKGIEVWIVSAGISNVIEEWLKLHGLSRQKIFILANRIYWKEGKASGYSRVVTTRNKAELFFGHPEVDLSKKLVFLGDRPEDICWREEHADSFLLDKCTGMVKKHKRNEKINKI